MIVGLSEIETMAFNASNGGVPVCKSGRSPLLNSLPTICNLIYVGSSSNALSVSVNVVSTGVTSYCTIT